MFKKRSTQQQNAAAIPSGIPRPAQTIINQAPSEAGRIFAWAIVLGIAGLVGWNVLLSLLEEMGARNPAEALGWFIFGGAGLYIVSLAVDRTITKLAGMWMDFELQREEIRADTARHQALTAGAPTPASGRLTGEQKRLFENLALVMQRAYQDLADSEGAGYVGNAKRPWSKRSVLEMEPPRYGRMPDSQATRIREWLAERNVIVGQAGSDQINTELFPAFADFQALLEEEFNLPVVVRTQKALPAVLRDEVSFVD